MADRGIQVSLHGIGLDGFGITREGDLVSRNRVIAPRSNKFIRYFDDFLGDVLRDEWNVVEGADTGTSDAVVTNAIGGTVRLTTGDSATTTWAGNGIQLTHGAFYNWKAANGGLYLEARVKLDDITTAGFFVGFTDLGTYEAPIISAGSGNTITTNATDAVGFMFDTNMTADNIWLVGVANNTDATAQNTGTAPVAATYNTLRVEVSSGGVASFFIDDVAVGTQMTGALTTTVALTPTIAATSLVAASRNLDVDYIDVGMDRV
jgi:hypothetical protein